MFEQLFTEDLQQVPISTSKSSYLEEICPLFIETYFISLFRWFPHSSSRIQESNSIKTGALMTEVQQKMPLPQLVKFAVENGSHLLFILNR